ncbi:MAG TPA: hypothetical protein PLA87_13325 [Pseudomonadota bacterium]|nr:hypothetical protein [Pseudomonadota bacterium]
MSAQAGCFREVIAQSCVASIERCSCGTLHIVLGPFTLKLSIEQYQKLLSTLLEGQSHLDEQAEPQQSAFALASLLSRHTPAGQS